MSESPAEERKHLEDGSTYEGLCANGAACDFKRDRKERFQPYAEEIPRKRALARSQNSQQLVAAMFSKK